MLGLGHVIQSSDRPFFFSLFVGICWQEKVLICMCTTAKFVKDVVYDNTVEQLHDDWLNKLYRFVYY